MLTKHMNFLGSFFIGHKRKYEWGRSTSFSRTKSYKYYFILFYSSK